MQQTIYHTTNKLTHNNLLSPWQGYSHDKP